ncbi:hypothetical protein B484DRAFT_461635, partial [Ochromonadaceae sp. CCMP2298]
QHSSKATTKAQYRFQLAVDTAEPEPPSAAELESDKNFDTRTFFKWFYALVDTYPEWCKQMQLRLEAGELDVPADQPFFDWQRGQPARALVLSLDNAPYHKGIACQLNSKTKGEMAAILRVKPVKKIEFNVVNANGDTVRGQAEVPEKGKDWDVGWPYLPYQKLIDEVKDLWGPQDEDGLQMLWNAEYVSTEIYIEMFWGQGKNQVSAPHNQYEGSTMADISRILHETWYKDPDRLCARLQRHCEEEMSRFINLDHAQHDGPLHGQVPNVQGLPSPAELLLWKQRTGMQEGGEYEPFDDGEGGSDDEDEE